VIASWCVGLVRAIFFLPLTRHQFTNVNSSTWCFVWDVFSSCSLFFSGSASSAICHVIGMIY
jgi:hypothetical protein